jgi:two-component system, NtrC family, response regulator HydG
MESKTDNRNINILIVDDNIEFCENVRDIVELRGFGVVTASDGIEAVRKAKETKPDLVIMDIRMPKMDGVTAFRQIKEISPGTPVILVTAYAGDSVIEDALREGVFGCLSKPVDFDELFDIVNKAASGRRLVLVVDDNKDLTVNIKDVLDSKGFVTGVAYDGKDAIAEARENRYDVILLDMNLPYFNGLEVYESVREVRPDVTVIVATGFPEEMGAMARETVEKSAYTWLEKPLDMDKLLSLLDRIKEQKAKGKLEKPGNEPGDPRSK